MNGNYEPGNCKWATRLEQNSNKRNCIYLISVSGKRVTLREYCRRHTLRYRSIAKRIKNGWPSEMAVSVRVGGKNANDAIALWEQNQELKEYLRLTLEAINGRPLLDRIISEAERAAA